MISWSCDHRCFGGTALGDAARLGLSRRPILRSRRYPLATWTFAEIPEAVSSLIGKGVSSLYCAHCVHQIQMSLFLPFRNVTPRWLGRAAGGRGAWRSNRPDPQCGRPSTADIPDGARAPAAVPRPPPSIAADPNPAAPRAATTPHRSSVEPSPQTPPGKSVGSVISNWHRGDILIGRLHQKVAEP